MRTLILTFYIYVQSDIRIQIYKYTQHTYTHDKLTADGWMGGGRSAEWIDGQRRADRRTDGQMDRTDRLTDRKTNR